jgi:hypothetical protein
MASKDPTKRQRYRLPIEIVQGGVVIPAGTEVSLLPRQVQQIESAARAMGPPPQAAPAAVQPEGGVQ